MANRDNRPSGSNDLPRSNANAVPASTTVDKGRMKHNNDVSPPKTNGNPTSKAKNDNTLSRAPAQNIASELQKTKGDQSASQGGTLPDHPNSTTVLGRASQDDSLNDPQTTGNEPLPTSQKPSKTKNTSILSRFNFNSKREDDLSKSDAKAVPPRTIVDGEPTAIPSEPSDALQLPPINSDAFFPIIDNALSLATAPSKGSKLFKTKGDDKSSNPAQSNRQTPSRSGTLAAATPSTTGASKGFLPKSFIPNSKENSKLNGGIDPSESNTDTDVSQTKGTNPPTKTKNTSILSRFTFNSKREDDLSKSDANPVPAANEGQTKPNTSANGDPSVSTSQPPRVNVDTDSHSANVEKDLPQTPRDPNPSQAADENGIEYIPKLDDEPFQRNPDRNYAPTTGDEVKTDENDQQGLNDESSIIDPEEVMDDRISESSESDGEDEQPELNEQPEVNEKSELNEDSPDLAQSPPNIIVFGETGVGKSSLIRMLGGSATKQPEVSGNAAGCTTDTAHYSITIENGKKKVGYRVWDTPGLGEGENGTVPTPVALKIIHDRVQKLEGVNLLVYCIRGAEYRDILQVHYDLVAKVVCGGKVPVVAVVSWLENEEKMESWWKANKRYLKKMKLKGHACVTTTKGKEVDGKFVFQEEYNDSKERVQKLVRTKCLSKGTKPEAIADIEGALKTYMDEHNSGTLEDRKKAGRLVRFFT